VKIYTRTGDAGETGLFGGGRVKKHHARVAAYGAVDEANACVGLAAAAADLPAPLHARLVDVMSDLFDAGAALATPRAAGEKLAQRLDSRVDDARVAALEAFIDEVDAEVPPLTTFVLPSGTEAAARLHVARTVLRRAERAITALLEEEPDAVDLVVVRYVNRLSDLLFSWARLCNHRAGRGDVPWQAKKVSGP
jgi:cob(I)alamin adenosyltransferase